MNRMKTIIVLCVHVASIWAASFEAKTTVQKYPGGRIIGGDVAEPGQFPYEVAVYYDTPQGSFFCGGALIASNWVLTAGHCVYQAKVFTLHLGSNSLVAVDPNRVTVGASHSVLHPDFDIDTLQNDIGLIRIDTAYTPNDSIDIIPIATTEVGSNVSVVVSGWGTSGDWDGVTPDLNFVGLKTISNAACRAVYGDVVTEGMVCASGPTNEGTCNGDSGSPLVTDDGNGNVVHVGIASWASASGCGAAQPSGYTRTAYYADWIKSVLGL